MAKKRKKEEKEAFKVPEFDEVEFMKKEISNAKVALLTIVFAVPIAVISYFFTLGGLPAAGFLVGLGAIFLLKRMYELFRMDTSEMERKDWIGNAGMFFFSWLAIWVLILNMPFTDLTSPTIGKVYMYGCPDEPEMKLDSKAPNECVIVVSSHSFSIETEVTDNSAVRHVMIETSSPSPGSFFMTEGSNNEYSYQMDLDKGQNLIFRIVAEDVNGHVQTSPSYTFIVS